MLADTLPEKRPKRTALAEAGGQHRPLRTATDGPQRQAAVRGRRIVTFRNTGRNGVVGHSSPKVAKGRAIRAVCGRITARLGGIRSSLVSSRRIQTGRPPWTRVNASHRSV